MASAAPNFKEQAMARLPKKPKAVEKTSDQFSPNGHHETNGQTMFSQEPKGEVSVHVNGDAQEIVEPRHGLHEVNGNGKTTKKPKPRNAAPAEPVDVAKISADLQGIQRQRAVVLKSRMMQENRLRAVVAGTLGYSSGLPEKERAAKFKEASALIRKIVKGGASDNPMAEIVRTTWIGIKAFEDMKKILEKDMVTMAKRLPVAPWVLSPDRRGFGLLGLAIVVGESGDLSSYANPGKLWKRLGCAPYSFGGKTLMGATWKGGKEGKLPADEWAKFGYSPRRRSISYLIGEGIVKQNFLKPLTDESVIATEGLDAGESLSEPLEDGDAALETDTGDANESDTGNETAQTSAIPGPYRARYNRVKVTAAEKHPDWKPLRVHRHAMLLATKELLCDLWVEWRRKAGIWTPDEWSKVSGRYGE